MMTSLSEMIYKEAGRFQGRTIVYNGYGRILDKIMDADLAATDETIAGMRRTVCVSDLTGSYGWRH